VNAATEVSLQKNPNAMVALVWAGFTCGVLDITAALVVYGFFGLKPMRLLQGIASGLLGPRAFSGGLTTALLGLLCHFLIAFGAAAVYLVASRALGFLIEHAVISGFLYGVAVYFFMNRIVLPLSAAVFYSDDDCRRGYTHLLRRAPHISQRAPIFEMIESRCSTTTCSRLME